MKEYHIQPWEKYQIYFFAPSDTMVFLYLRINLDLHQTAC